MGRHRMSPADSNSSQEQVQRPLFSSLFLSNPLKKRFLCLQYSGGSDVEVSAGSQYVPTRISCVKDEKFPRAKVKISPWTKVKFWGLARTQWLAQRCNNLHLPSGFLQISNFVPKETSFPTCTNYLLFLAKGWKVRLPVGSTCFCSGTGTTPISLFCQNLNFPVLPRFFCTCNYANNPHPLLYCTAL